MANVKTLNTCFALLAKSHRNTIISKEKGKMNSPLQVGQSVGPGLAAYTNAGGAHGLRERRADADCLSVVPLVFAKIFPTVDEVGGSFEAQNDLFLS